MITIKQDEFEQLTYKLESSEHKTHIFKCDQNPQLNIELFEGSDNEHFWVCFVNDVNVLASDDTDTDDLIDDTNYLNIDARPEIIFESLYDMLENHIAIRTLKDWVEDAKNISELCDALNDYCRYYSENSYIFKPAEEKKKLSEIVDMSSLPTLGGDDIDVINAWSWDADNVLMQDTGTGEFEIVTREWFFS